MNSAVMRKVDIPGGGMGTGTHGMGKGFKWERVWVFVRNREQQAAGKEK